MLRVAPAQRHRLMELSYDLLLEASICAILFLRNGTTRTRKQLRSDCV
jgi:hypothetical protein